jgi:glycine/D-amino acid oxidase-like deaminating enzyme
MRYEFVIIGAGIAGSAISYFLQNKKVLVVDKEGICQKASNAAGAFLFPKVGFNTKYTKFVNEALLYSFKFYESIGIDTNKTGVLILPRDEKDIQKFKEYKKSFTLKYFEKENGFFFSDGGIVNSEKVCEKLLENCEFKKEEILNIEDKGGYYLLNNKIETENIILATGWEEILKIPYIKIRPVWGQRIEVETDISLQNHTHKNCSFSKNENGIVKIGATHERIWEDKAPNQVSAQILIDKANEITKLTNYKIYSMKSGMRAGSVDYFPIIGEIIDTEKTLQLYPEVKKGRIPKEVIYKKGIFIINGGGGRGFSNYIYSAKILSESILNNKIIPEYLDSKRLFIKWARKL